MAPTASKKGSKNTAARDRRSSSRQSTPLSAIGDTAPPTPMAGTPTSAAGMAQSSSSGGSSTGSSMPKETAYIHTQTAALVSSEPSIETLIEKAYANSAVKNATSDPPPARDLRQIHDRIRDSVNKFMTRRGEVCDRSMRQLAQKRKERVQLERELAAAEEAQRAEEAKKAKKASSANGKKRSAEEMMDSEREEKKEALPSVGAHGVARQDGVGVGEGVKPPPSPVILPGTAALAPMDSAGSPSDSEESRADPPSTAPLYERAFGKDPTQFDDPTVYDIREIYDGMPREQKQEILNVAQWPESDLRDLTAGDPPDMDFSNAKPQNQISFSTFQAYAEPFIRPFTEEDVAYLKERGERSSPYLIPQRGQRGYKEVWAVEDGMDGIAPPRKHERDPNEARGSMDDMNDDTAETDEVSMGPVMNRLLSIIRPAPNGNAKKDTNEDAEGDTSMVNGDITAGLDGLDPSQALPGAAEEHKPATYLPADAPRPAAMPNGASDYDTLEQRTIQELRHIGFLTPNEVPGADFAAHNDDEVAARLRTLQHELRRVSRINNVRKARVLELTEERMAMQEYSNIADDLDNQVNAAYLKRNRSLSSKPSKKSGSSQHPRPGQKGVAVGGGIVGGRGVSDGVRALMQKRKDWIDMVGPVVGFGRPYILGEDETIFDDASLKRLERSEREAELGDGEEG